jgi:nicotinamidase-related amidase
MTVPIAQSALLVIDAQDSFKVRPRWEKRNNPSFDTNVAALIEAYRKASLPVVFIMHADADPGFKEDSEHFKLMSFIDRRPEEPLFVKRTRNAFTSTALQPHLLSKGVRRIAISGIQTEQCCESTARLGADFGFEVDFVTEATLTFPIADPGRPGIELGTDAIRERTEYALRGRFARIATVAQLVAQLEAR